MCGTCGCGDAAIVSVDLEARILAGNDRAARHNREHFAADGVLAVNLMGSPGAGKTAVLEGLARLWSGTRRVAALAGDLETERDAERLRAAGLPTHAITTGSACHLDAAMVHHGLHHLEREVDAFDTLFIENVGNLVCPAVFDLGQSANVVALSVTEGEDKPLKYPAMFRGADLVLLTKTDLLPHLPGYRVAAVEDALRRTMPEPAVIPLSAATGEGLRLFATWLDARRTRPRSHERERAHAATG